MALEEWDATLLESVSLASGDGAGTLADVVQLRPFQAHEYAPSRPVADPFPWAPMAKRAFDIAAAVLLMVLLMPLFVVLALGVLASSRGGVFFRHERVGMDGRIFRLVKFRSMVAGTHERIWSDAEAVDAFMAGNFKLPGDHPSITPFGKFLRLTSLDELPQLWNVLRGQMSLVGVRPLVPAEVAARSIDEQYLYRTMRPGITGLWQVNGRSSLEHADRCALDRQYVEEWSLGMDAMILLRTPLAVLRPHHTA